VKTGIDDAPFLVEVQGDLGMPLDSRDRINDDGSALFHSNS
jgi:hypothetical protein